MSKSDWMCKQCSDFCRESERRKHKVKKTLRRHLVWVTQVFLSSGRLLKMLFFFFQLLRWEEPRWWVNWEHLAVRLPLAPCCFFKSTSLFCVSHQQQAPHIHKHTLLWRVTRYVCHQVVLKTSNCAGLMLKSLKGHSEEMWDCFIWFEPNLWMLFCWATQNLSSDVSPPAGGATETIRHDHRLTASDTQS